MSFDDLHESIQDEKKEGYCSSGLHTVVIRNLKDKVKRKEFKSHREIRDLIRKMKMSLSRAQEDLLNLFDEVTKCQHSYGNPTYTFQRRVLGYVYVYQRACTLCGHPEYFQCRDEEHNTIEKPEWTKGAESRFYNNFI